MTVPLTSIRPLVLSHILVVRDTTKKNLFRAFMHACEAWPDYDTKILRLEAELKNETLSEDEKKSSAFLSMLLLSGVKDGIAADLLARVSMEVIVSLSKESGLSNEEFSLLVCPDDSDFRTALLSLLNGPH